MIALFSNRTGAYVGLIASLVIASILANGVMNLRTLALQSKLKTALAQGLDWKEILPSSYENGNTSETHSQVTIGLVRYSIPKAFVSIESETRDDVFAAGSETYYANSGHSLHIDRLRDDRPTYLSGDLKRLPKLNAIYNASVTFKPRNEMLLLVRPFMWNRQFHTEITRLYDFNTVNGVIHRMSKEHGEAVVVFSRTTNSCYYEIIGMDDRQVGSATLLCPSMSRSDFMMLSDAFLKGIQIVSSDAPREAMRTQENSSQL
jgi:hypothetical protein